MRIDRVKVTNVGGLQDCDLELPHTDISAIAGPNGTGKSKLLACILAPWTGAIPQPGKASEPAEVALAASFTGDEIAALARFGPTRGWGPAELPEGTVVMKMSHSHGGFTFQTEPQVPALQHALRDTVFLGECPTMDMVYLPAERRLLAHDGGLVDLSQVSPERSVGSTMQGRAQVHSGALDDNDFVSYARALCVAGNLPSEDDSDDGGSVVAQTKWVQFKHSIDTLLYPKQLLPLTQQHPDQLRIGLPGGDSHPVQALSSGERQALIIVSRVFRAGDRHSLLAIDEPDAYLHPTLSSKLMAAISPGVGSGAQILLATHSPSILNSLEPRAIIRLSHDRAPANVEGEEERIALYREAGFRTSALTQADLLLVTEGDFDAEILPQLLPVLGGAAIHAAGGRASVLATLRSLTRYDIPIVGVIDADVHTAGPESSIAGRCHVWGAADIEGVLLSDQAFIQGCIDGRLMKPEYCDVERAETLLHRLLERLKEYSVAEMAMQGLRGRSNISWPSPRATNVRERILSALSETGSLTAADIEAEWGKARASWDDPHVSKWKLVRGKWIVDDFARTATESKSGHAFIRAGVARRPAIVEVGRLEALIACVLASRG